MRFPARLGLRISLALTVLGLCLGAAPAFAALVATTGLGAGQTDSFSFEFLNPAGGSLLIEGDSVNVGSTALSPDLIHLADVNFSGPIPQVFYRAYVAEETAPGAYALSDQGLGTDIEIQNLRMSISGIPGLPDLQEFPAVDVFDLQIFLEPAHIEQMRSALGVGSLSAASQSGGALGALVTIPLSLPPVPEPSTALMIGLGLAALSTRSRRDG